MSLTDDQIRDLVDGLWDTFIIHETDVKTLDLLIERYGRYPGVLYFPVVVYANMAYPHTRCVKGDWVNLLGVKLQIIHATTSNMERVCAVVDELESHYRIYFETNNSAEKVFQFKYTNEITSTNLETYYFPRGKRDNLTHLSLHNRETYVLPTGELRFDIGYDLEIFNLPLRDWIATLDPDLVDPLEYIYKDRLDDPYIDVDNSPIVMLLDQYIPNRLSGSIIPNVIKELDPEYWISPNPYRGITKSDFYPSRLMVAGIPPRRLMWLMGGYDTTNLTTPSVLKILRYAEDHLELNNSTSIEGPATIPVSPLWGLDMLESIRYGYERWTIEDRGADPVIDKWYQYLTSRAHVDFAAKYAKRLKGTIDVTVTFQGREHNDKVQAHRILDILDSKDLVTWPHAVRTALPTLEHELLAALESNKHLTPPPFDIPDDRYVFLDQTRKVISEGDRMSHCAASYVSKCLKGDSWLYHVDDGTEHGITVEIVSLDGVYRCNQAMGYGNVPKPEYQQLTNNYLRGI